MTDFNTVVYVVDDDQAFRLAIGRLLRAEGIRYEAFASAEDFLAAELEDGPACLLLDVEMPQSSGFDLQRQLNNQGRSWPIAFLTGHGTIPMTVQALKAGAEEFLTKPIDGHDLLRAVTELQASAIRRHQQWLHINDLRQRYSTLTPREREVLPLLARGLSNKALAQVLSTSEITAKVHKRHVMAKMSASSSIELAMLFETINADGMSLAQTAGE